MAEIPNISNRQHAEFVRLFVGHERQIYAYIRSLVPQHSDAENILQETAVVMWEKFDEFTPDTEFVHWAISIARFKILNYHKKRKRDSITFSQPLFDAIDRVSAELAENPVDLREVLEACLGRLEAADQELFRRRHLSGLTVPKLAAELGRPATTIYHALDRIRRALFTCVERQLNKEARP